MKIDKLKYHILCLSLCSVAVTAQPALPVQPMQPIQGDINESYRHIDDVSVWVQRFEVEGREVFDLRNRIIDASGIQSGQSVADVGAGTGLFVPLLANRVGPHGTVYAVDIVPEFIDLIGNKAAEHQLENVHTVLSSERSVELPAASVDVVFTSDAYHHFVYYEDMLASIYRALKPAGRLIVVDFDAVPGKSPERLLQHVRGSKEQFTAEIEANGFTLEQDIMLEGMQENFMRTFVKR